MPELSLLLNAPATGDSGHGRGPQPRGKRIETIHLPTQRPPHRDERLEPQVTKSRRPQLNSGSPLASACAQKLLERVGLSAKQDAYPRNLSGGQQQRVAIARAPVMEPAALLFDEPTSALDPVMAGEILALMADLAQDGQTMIVVTHSMAFARNVAHQVHVFAGGYDVEFGPPLKVFEDPQHPTTQSFLAQTAKD